MFWTLKEQFGTIIVVIKLKYDFGDFVVNVIVEHKNNKNVYFRIDDKLNLLVTCPKYMLEIDIKNLIDKNEDSIKKMYKKAINKNKDNDKFRYLGKKYDIVFASNLPKVGFKNDIVYTENLEMLDKFWEAECLHVFTGEIDICRKCFSELPDFKLRVRKMKTRWGVCNTRDKIITLNSELLHYEIWVIDYVIIHEMCHFYEGNHGKHFWELVATACPKYKEAKKALK
jgi:predicted metal-dependent hydrolase